MAKKTTSIIEISPQSLGEVISSPDDIQRKIYTLRGVQVMIDRDLAELYQVTTSALNQAVKRNVNRFPNRYMFQLTAEEFAYWKSQIVITNSEKMGLRQRPFVFTEQGISQLSAVLRSQVAVEVSIRIIDAFVAMRHYITANAGMLQRIESLEEFKLETRQEFKSIGERFDEIMNRLDDGRLKAKMGVFFDGQMFDAFAMPNIRQSM